MGQEAQQTLTWAQIARAFCRLRDRAGLETGLQRRTGVHDKPRHYALYDAETDIVVLDPRTVALGPRRVAGLLAHELGHALDALEVHRGKRSYDEVELAADDLAERAFGLCIYYGEDNVQAAYLPDETPPAGFRRPRPAGLR